MRQHNGQQKRTKGQRMIYKTLQTKISHYRIMVHIYMEEVVQVGKLLLEPFN